jgi:hypothetical protein
VLASVGWGEPAWCLALDQLGVVGGDAVGDVGYGEVGQNSMEQELTEVLPDFHLFTLSVIGEDVGDDRGVVFIDDVVLGVAGGEDDGAAHGDMGTEEGWGSYVLVVDQGLVDLVECSVRDDLVGGVVSFGVEGGFGGGGAWEVARDLSFGLGVYSRDEFWYGGLLSLASLPQVLLSFDISGVFGVFGWWVWVGGWCLEGVSICAGVGAGVGGWVVVIGAVVGDSLLLPLFLLPWVGAGAPGAPG